MWQIQVLTMSDQGPRRRVEVESRCFNPSTSILQKMIHRTMLLIAYVVQLMLERRAKDATHHPIREDPATVTALATAEPEDLQADIESTVGSRPFPHRSQPSS